MMWRGTLALGAIALAAACPGPKPCNGNSECNGNEICVEQLCRRTCNNSSECATGESCLAGACLPGRDGGMADARAGDGARSDAVRPDAAARDSGHDGAVADGAVADGAIADQAVGDAARTDSAHADVAGADQASSDASCTGQDVGAVCSTGFFGACQSGTRSCMNDRLQCTIDWPILTNYWPVAVAGSSGAGGVICDDNRGDGLNDAIYNDTHGVGLARSSDGSTGFIMLDGHFEVACLTFDLGRQLLATRVFLNVRSVATVCSDSGNLPAVAEVFFGQSPADLSFAGTSGNDATYSPADEIALPAPRTGRYLAVCRSGASHSNYGNLQVDAVSVFAYGPETCDGADRNCNGVIGDGRHLTSGQCMIDGTLGAPELLAAGMPTAMRAPVAVVGDRVFLVGGRDSSGLRNSVHVNSFDTAGELAANWAIDPSDLPTPRDSPLVTYMTTSGDYLAVVGGESVAVSPELAEVLTAHVGNGGVLGPWTSSTPLPFERRGHGIAVFRSYLYVAGGLSGPTGPGPLRDVIVGDIDPASGAITGWRNVTPPSSVPVQQPSLIAANDRLYLVGGQLDPGQLGHSVRSIGIASEGTLVGDWTDHPRIDGDSVWLGPVQLLHNFLVMPGGKWGDIFTDMVHSAPLLDDGQVGRWTMVSNPIPNYKGPSAAVHGEYLYTFGGFGNGDDADGNWVVGYWAEIYRARY